MSYRLPDGWSELHASTVLGNRHLDSCRVLNDANPHDIIFVSKVGHAYDPPVYFAEGSDVYADTSNLYGQVILFDAEGKPVIRGNEVVTRFMRVPIAETS